MSKICFVSYELHPSTWGGCGVLLYNAAHILLKGNHEVIFLLDVPQREFENFTKKDIYSFPNHQNCRAYLVDRLCEDMQPGETDFSGWSLWKSYRFFHACRKVCQVESPDVVEFFDYCGPAYYALNAKVAGLCFRKQHIAVRLHNSREMIDAFEPTKPLNYENYLMYALEHFSLRLAESTLFPSESYLNHSYLPLYEDWFGAKEPSQSPIVDAPSPGRTGDTKDVVLFYGRLFAFKGADAFVDAAVIYLDNPANPRLEFHLVGYDSNETPVPAPDYRSYLGMKIPGPHRARFHFPGHLSWRQLGDLLPRVRFAVFPSLLESFCYAAHELYSAGIPIVVSDIPGFRDFFRNLDNAVVFDGSVMDLARAMQVLASDEALRCRITRPYPSANNPLGGFYGMDSRRSWIKTGTGNGKKPALLVCLIDDGQGDINATVDSVIGSGMSRIELVVLRSQGPGTGDRPAAWFLGGMYRTESASGNPVNPTEILTEDALLVLLAGDRLSPGFLDSAAGILAGQDQISFVGSWKKVRTGDAFQIDTFPLDAMLEVVPFISYPPLSRCVMKTVKGKLLLDLFARQAGIYGELDYLWRLETDRACGMVVPEPLVEQRRWNAGQIDLKTISYLLLRNGSHWRKDRLGKLLLVCEGLGGKSLEPVIRRKASSLPQSETGGNDRPPWGKPGFNDVSRLAEEILNGRELARLSLRKLRLKILRRLGIGK